MSTVARMLLVVALVGNAALTAAMADATLEHFETQHESPNSGPVYENKIK